MPHGMVVLVYVCLTCKANTLLLLIHCCDMRKWKYISNTTLGVRRKKHCDVGINIHKCVANVVAGVTSQTG